MTVLGRSGTGKSVLLKLIVGLQKPDAGSIHVGGQEIVDVPLERLNEIRKKLGFLFQQAALYDSLTVEENVAFPLARHTDLPDAERRQRAAELLSRVALGAVVRSGGVRIGIVDKIRMPRRSGEKVTVVMKLRKATQEVIKKDSVASIETEGLLGAKYVTVSFGSTESEPVRDGDGIASRPPLDLGELAKKASDALTNVDAAAASMRSIAAKIDAGEGTVGALVNDKKIYQDLSRSMAEAKASVTGLHESVDALKHNRLVRGFFNRRGYFDPKELTAHEIAALPGRPALKTFVYAAKDLFDKDTAKLKHEKPLDEVGKFLEARLPSV